MFGESRASAAGEIEKSRDQPDVAGGGGWGCERESGGEKGLHGREIIHARVESVENVENMSS